MTDPVDALVAEIRCQGSFRVIQDVRPQPWLHYVPIRDDFSDLAKKVEWCDGNRDKCRQIGQQAKAFFEAHSMPEAIWRYVKRRMSE